MPRLTPTPRALPFTENEGKFLSYLLHRATMCEYPPRWYGAAARLARRIERCRYNDPVVPPPAPACDGCGFSTHRLVVQPDGRTLCQPCDAYETEEV